MVTDEGSWIDIGCKCVPNPSIRGVVKKDDRHQALVAGSFFDSSAAMSSSDEVVVHRDCSAETKQGIRESTSCESGVHKRSDDNGKENEIPSTPGKGCSSTDCRCETCRNSATASGRDFSQEECHREAAEKPARLCQNRAVPPNLKSLQEPLRRYLGSSISENPWLPKGLLQDPSVVPNWIINVAEQEP
jgi:hypothetical protein